MTKQKVKSKDKFKFRLKNTSNNKIDFRPNKSLNNKLKSFLILTTVSILTLTLNTSIKPNFTYADEPGQQYVTPEVASAPAGPQTQHGTGQYYANAACPYQQSTLPASVIQRAERIKNYASEINQKLQLATRRRENIQNERLFSTCRTAVNRIIRKACGGGSEAKGEAAIDDFEDHMRGVNDGFDFMSSSLLNYTQTHEFYYNAITTSELSSDRMVASGEGDDPGVTNGFEALDPETLDPKGGDDNDGGTDDDDGGGGRNSCSSYKVPGGAINNQICFNAGEKNSDVKQYCKDCLKPSGGYPRGLYPEKFEEYFNLEQDIARLEREYRDALGKAQCVETHIDNAPESGPDAGAFQRCIMAADPEATTADYCLYCDSSGGAAQQERKGFDLNRWGPSLLTGALWLGGGIYANNQAKKTREGNWEAGYPSDDRSPWVMSSYVMNGFGAVTNQLQAAGAFGCSPSAGLNGQGQTNANVGIGGFLQGLFGGNSNVQVGGANGYPPGWTGGAQGNLSGGIFGGNPTAGPWGAQGGVGGGINIEAERQRIAQQQAALDAAIQQNNQNQINLNALAQLQTTISGLDAENARLAQQRAALMAQAQGIYSNLNTSSAGGGYGNGYGQTGTGAGLRIGLDVSGWGGIGAGMSGGYSGAPGTGYPPMPYNNGYPGLPNNSGNNYNGNGNPGSGSSTDLAVPGLGI